MRVIHVPMREMLWPPKKRRKLRWPRARQAWGGGVRGRESVTPARVVFSVGLKFGGF